MRSISVDFIPDHLQRYKTLDDYSIVTPDAGPDILQVLISDTGDPRSNLALLIHALVEQFCAEVAGVTIEQIDAWDLSHPDSPEPGEENGCPYLDAHTRAMLVERWAVRHLGLAWADHESNLENCGKVKVG